MVRTDYGRRGVPWVSLLVSRRELPATLNLGARERASVSGRARRRAGHRPSSPGPRRCRARARRSPSITTCSRSCTNGWGLGGADRRRRAAHGAPADGRCGSAGGPARVGIAEQPLEARTPVATASAASIGFRSSVSSRYSAFGLTAQTSWADAVEPVHRPRGSRSTSSDPGCCSDGIRCARRSPGSRIAPGSGGSRPPPHGRRVVHRIGLSEPHLDPVDYLRRIDHADPLELRLGDLDRVGSESSQMGSSSEQKYSTPRHVVPGRTIPGLQAPKFWTRPVRSPGVVEVDPVVGERLLLRRHQGDEAEAAVAQFSGGRLRRCPGAAGPATASARERDARHDLVDRVLLSLGVPLDHDRFDPARRG